MITQFLEACIEQQPDITLIELQDHLQEVCGTEVSTNIKNTAKTWMVHGVEQVVHSAALVGGGT